MILGGHEKSIKCGNPLKLKIKHFDLFRLNSQAEIKNLDLFEENENCITLVEWPQIIKKKPKNSKNHANF